MTLKVKVGTHPDAVFQDTTVRTHEPAGADIAELVARIKTGDVTKVEPHKVTAVAEGLRLAATRIAHAHDDLVDRARAIVAKEQELVQRERDLEAMTLSVRAREVLVGLVTPQVRRQSWLRRVWSRP